MTTDTPEPFTPQPAPENPIFEILLATRTPGRGNDQLCCFSYSHHINRNPIPCCDQPAKVIRRSVLNEGIYPVCELHEAWAHKNQPSTYVQ